MAVLVRWLNLSVFEAASSSYDSGSCFSVVPSCGQGKVKVEGVVGIARAFLSTDVRSVFQACRSIQRKIFI